MSDTWFGIVLGCCIGIFLTSVILIPSTRPSNCESVIRASRVVIFDDDGKAFLDFCLKDKR